MTDDAVGMRAKCAKADAMFAEAMVKHHPERAAAAIRARPNKTDKTDKTDKTRPFRPTLPPPPPARVVPPRGEEVVDPPTVISPDTLRKAKSFLREQKEPPPLDGEVYEQVEIKTEAATPDARGRTLTSRQRMAKDLIEAGKTAVEIAKAMQVSRARVYQIARDIGVSIQPSGDHEDYRGPGVRKTDTERLARVTAMVEAGKTVREIAEAEGDSLNKTRSFLHYHKIKAARAPKAPKGKRNGVVDQVRAERASKGADAIRDRRRFKTTPVPMGQPIIKLQPADKAAKDGHSRFRSRVFEPSAAEPVLKDGSSNSKIGGDVLVGWLKGARIVTLTLEERATCPRSCGHWLTCYGNSMQFARRWRPGKALERRITAEVRALCAEHAQVLVRLHVLGDFYSEAYVHFWRGLLAEHAGLHAFGFTAHAPDTAIGGAIAATRIAFPRRFWIRHSGMGGPWGSFTVDFPTQKKMIGDALVCPEQVDGMNGGPEGRHCGNCAACWSSPIPIAFVEH